MRTAREDRAQGRLADNVLHFARLLRDAGLPVGPASTIDAIEAVTAAGIGQRGDFRATLEAVLVKKREHRVLFDQAFDLFWRKRGLVDARLDMAAQPRPARTDVSKPKAGARRLAEALAKPQVREEQRQIEIDRRATVSNDERLRVKDFAQMSADEITRARAAIAALRLSGDEVQTRRLAADPRGLRLDPRVTFRRSLRTGGASIDLAFRARTIRKPPIVAICDISGSMSDYTRIFLHFLHALMAQRPRVGAFLFGTRLTNVTRALQHKDPDAALAQCAGSVEDWAGGTRIATSLHVFNRLWSRRVLGQGAIVLLFTDGLERETGSDLAREMERLKKSCRRVIWLNPLLRYDRFEAKAQGIRTMLPYVDAFMPIHNLAAVTDLTLALSQGAERLRDDPRRWLRQ